MIRVVWSDDDGSSVDATESYHDVFMRNDIAVTAESARYACPGCPGPAFEVVPDPDGLGYFRGFNHRSILNPSMAARVLELIKTAQPMGVF